MNTIIPTSNTSAPVAPAADVAALMSRPAWAATLALLPLDAQSVGVVAATAPIPVQVEAVASGWDPSDGPLDVIVRRVDYLRAEETGLVAEPEATEVTVHIGGLWLNAAQGRALAQAILSGLDAAEGGAR